MIDNLIRAATCRVSCGRESGTGHLIADCKILTARHCVIPAIESGDAIELIFSGPEGDIRVAATITAESEDLDTCILSISTPLERQPLPLNAMMPREGTGWRSFGFPVGKTIVGHRIFGEISHVLDFPKLRMDIDLTVEPSTAPSSYHGLSGAALVTEGASRGMIRVKVDETLGAISIQRLVEFLSENGIDIPHSHTGEPSGERQGVFAPRIAFQKSFEQMMAQNSGDYIFLEGAHGIGKTTFCNQFQPQDQRFFVLGTYSFGSRGRGPGAISRAQPQVFFDWLSMAVSRLLTGRPSREEERTYEKLVKETPALLEAFSKYCTTAYRHGILFIDGLNEAQAADSSAFVKLIGLLPQMLPGAITIVVTAPNYDSVAVSLAGRVKTQNIISLPALSEEASSAYCWDQISKDRVTPALVERICEKAQGHPLYLRYLIEYVNGGSEGDALDDFPTLTGPIEQYYESLWPRLLQDPEAINLLAIMARLRWGIAKNDFVKILTTAEQKMFIPTVTRIRHLLLNPDTTTIYHPSFAEYLISKTMDLDIIVQKQLADFCCREPGLEYCALNVVFHLLRSDDVERSKAVVLCNQKWVDTCVGLGVEPDTLLFDIETALHAAVILGPAVEPLRLLLLSQRMTFRYNALFPESACLLAEALIALKRPTEALKHTIRLNTLIVDAGEALQIAYGLIQHQFPAEAIKLLRLLYPRIVEGYGFESELQEFIGLCKLHLQTLFLMRLADGRGRMQQIFGVLEHAKKALSVVLAEEPPELFQESFDQIYCVFTNYFLSYRNTYTSFAQIKEKFGERVPPGLLMGMIWTLFECQESLEIYNLPKNSASLPMVFSDIEELIGAGERIDIEIVSAVLDTLIQLGAPSSVVHLVADMGETVVPQPLRIKADNGVDVDFQSIKRGATEWRILAFLKRDFACPLVGPFNETAWLSSLDQLIRVLSWCEGMARRAKADGDAPRSLHILENLKAAVLQPLSFTLAQRVTWQDSYAIPETLFPLLYERITSIFLDCFPEKLPVFLQALIERALDQCGLYSEGFREVMFAVLRKLTVQDMEPALVDQAFDLLQCWKNHVINGVENRHELVPEILKLIPLLVKLGASEEAEGLYRHMLSVSMGPSWYKEDQLGLMVSVLRKMPPSENVQAVLPLIAGYLEHASGEMTFQRYVRYEKQAFIGELFRRNRFVSGCQYFKRETCGSMSELLYECQQGTIDKPNPMVGMRHPGGALDEQQAILCMVRNAGGTDWRVRWALLEVFLFGDERHLDDYAVEFAKLFNEMAYDAAGIPEMTLRIEFVVGADINPEKRNPFLKKFRSELNETHRDALSEIMVKFSPAGLEDKQNGPIIDSTPAGSPLRDLGSEEEENFYVPGLFGRQSALKEADAALEAAESNLKLRNVKAAKTAALSVLQLAQAGGWSIWGNLSHSASRAEAVLREGAEDAADLIRTYASLVEGERYAQKSRLAEHLISKVADLMTEKERYDLLQYVIDHIHLMVGDATEKIAIFSFLNDEPECDASIELFKLILWLLDHPHWLRREKAAGMTAWLVESNSIYFDEAANEAFSMVPRYSADIVCGVLDNMSRKQPMHLWERLFPLLNPEDIFQKCKHVSRLAVLHRIAERAGNAGSITGGEIASRARTIFRSGTVELASSATCRTLPQWARFLSQEWDSLCKVGLLSDELSHSLEENVADCCTPLGAVAGWKLETAVSTSFRESPERRLNRWEGKVRFALNTALFPYASTRDFQGIESILRVFNPSLPETTVTPGLDSPADADIKAILDGEDYTGAIGNKELFYLSYHGFSEYADKPNIHLEVVAVVVSAASIRGGALPHIDTYFRSKDLPDLMSGSSHETCCHLKPNSALFGPFTPAFPLPSFIELIKAKESDFIRVNWRNGRSDDLRFFGRPVKEGCFLAVKREAVSLPSEKELAWIIRVNGNRPIMIDSRNNQLL